MFSRRLQYKSNNKFNRAFFEKLVSDLAAAGFDEIDIKLPYKAGEKSEKLSSSDFLKRERNYPSLILSAHDSKHQDELKILFVNLSRRVYFDDDTFPSGHSEPPEIFVRSSDPARAYSLSSFFQEFFNEQDLRSRNLITLLFLPAILVMFLQAVSLAQNKVLFLTSNGWPVYTDLIVIGAVLFIDYRFLTTERGLYIKEREHPEIEFLRRALRGDFRDNLIVFFVISFAAPFLAGVVLWLLGMV